MASGLPTFICGDLNFVDDAVNTSSAAAFLLPATHLAKFQALLEHFAVVEVPHTEHTYFHLTSDVNSPYSHSARLDRFYIPMSIACSLVYTASVTIKPHHFNYHPHQDGPRRCFSDHLPVALGFVNDSTETGNRPTIPLWLAQSPEFKEAVFDTWRPPLDQRCPFTQLVKFKKALFKAATRTRKLKLAAASLPLKLSQHISLLRHIAVLNQDLVCIARLLEVAPALDSLITFRDGLETTARDLLIRASTPHSPAPSLHPTTVLKDKLPGTNARITNLREETLDPPTFSESGKSSIAASYWSKV